MITRRTLVGAALTGCAGFVACSRSEQASEGAAATEAQPTTLAGAEEAPRYDPEDLKRRLDAGEDIFLLDVRRPDELEEIGTIEGYNHIPMDQLESRMSEIPKGKPLVIYWNRGGRASRAAALLQENGYTDITFGGVIEWKEKGYDVIYPKASELGGGQEEGQ